MPRRIAYTAHSGSTLSYLALYSFAPLCRISLYLPLSLFHNHTLLPSLYSYHHHSHLPLLSPHCHPHSAAHNATAAHYLVARQTTAYPTTTLHITVHHIPPITSPFITSLPYTPPFMTLPLRHVPQSMPCCRIGLSSCCAAEASGPVACKAGLCRCMLSLPSIAALRCTAWRRPHHVGRFSYALDDPDGHGSHRSNDGRIAHLSSTVTRGTSSRLWKRSRPPRLGYHRHQHISHSRVIASRHSRRLSTLFRHAAQSCCSVAL
jgi:hypothetical protein